MDSNVIPFPKPYIAHPDNITSKEAKENVKDVQINHIMESISTIIPILFNNIEIAGFSVSENNEDECKNENKDGAFVVEAIRSLMCRHYGIYHPFQKVIENLLIDDPDNEFGIIIADSINLNLKSKDSKVEEVAEASCESN